jgi:hypothetical protein
MARVRDGAGAEERGRCRRRAAGGATRTAWGRRGAATRRVQGGRRRVAGAGEACAAGGWGRRRAPARGQRGSGGGGRRRRLGERREERMSTRGEPLQPVSRRNPGPSLTLPLCIFCYVYVSAKISINFLMGLGTQKTSKEKGF